MKFAEQSKYKHLYRKQRWRNIARDQLRRFPNCAMCEAAGQIIEANVADHKIPHHGDEMKFWFGQLQSLCYSHHNGSKQQLERRGFVTDIGADGFPIDSQHPFNKSRKRK
jgi:5-methylcytosine-specific restriction endonuclease McrA